MDTERDDELIQHARRQTAALESLRSLVWMWSALAGLAVVVGLLVLVIRG